jgi:hypothetical protein
MSTGRKVFNGQAAQDYFVLACLKGKKNGTFLEIGSNDPVEINNTYFLERDHGWRGIMVEYMSFYLRYYQQFRPNSHWVIDDAQKVNYRKEIADAGLPSDIDYLQIDLEVNNESTLNTLKALDADVMNTHRFAVVTFEHDIYTGDHFNTRAESRAIFERRGYVRVFSDVSNDGNPYEDWYVHPDLVDMEYIRKIRREESMDWKDIIEII